MTTIRSMKIDPPIINASTLPATNFAQIQALHLSPLTGATVTGTSATVTRTSTISGFSGTRQNSAQMEQSSFAIQSVSTSSVISLKCCIGWVKELLTPTEPDEQMPKKPFVISIAERTPVCLGRAVGMIQDLRKELRKTPYASSMGPSPVDPSKLVAIEVDVSRPGFPPASNPQDLIPFLDVLAAAFREDPSLVIGLKLPLYSGRPKVVEVVEALAMYTATPSPWTFLTSGGTLGSSLALPDQLLPEEHDTPSSSGAEAPQNNGTNTSTTLQAMRGAPEDVVHSLALWNIAALREALNASSDVMRDVHVIGVGGVTNHEAVDRMVTAGASVVAADALLEVRGTDSLKDLAG